MKKMKIAVIIVIAALILALSCSAVSAVYGMADRKDAFQSVGDGVTAAEENGVKGYSFSNGAYLSDSDCGVDFTKPFSVSVTARAAEEYTSGFAILFAYNEKSSGGHIELYLDNGVVNVYAPGVNGGNPVASSVNLADHKTHHVAFSYDGQTFLYYENGEKTNEYNVSGMPGAGNTRTLTVGALNEGGLNFPGFIGDLRIFDKVLSADDVKQLNTVGTQTVKPVVEEEPKLLFEDKTIYEINAGDGSRIIADFTPNIADKFTISGFFNTSSAEPFSVIIAKGVKAPAHFEVYIDNGELAFYAPEIANNNAVKSGVAVTDGNDHRFAVTYDGSRMSFFVDGSAAASAEVGGAITPQTLNFGIGTLVEGGFTFDGKLGDIKIYNYDIGTEKAMELSALSTPADTGDNTEPTEPGHAENPDTSDIPAASLMLLTVISAAGAAFVLGKRPVKK